MSFWKLLLLGVFVQAAPNIDYGFRMGKGDRVEAGQAPFHVSFQIDGEHYCGGAILNQRIIITAAHCIDVLRRDYLSTWVLAGTVSLSEGGTKHQIEEIFVHPDYVPSSRNYNADLALMRLTEPLKFDNFTQPIQVEPKEVPVGSQVSVFGWGLTEKLEYPDQLQTIDQRTISNKECDDLNNAYRPAPPVTSGMLCAMTWEDGKATCFGDSGGPLVYNGRIVGLTSWGVDCFLKDIPDVYTRLSHYQDWIASILELNK